MIDSVDSITDAYIAGQSRGMSTKRSFSSFLLSIALLAPLAVACSSADASNDGEQGSNESDIKQGKNKKATCESVFGQCVGISPSSCVGGSWADANAVTCGGGIGVGCCVKPTPPPPPPANNCTNAGGKCVGLSPSSCTDGRWGDATTFSCGGGLGVGCCLPQCPALSPPAPGWCADGTITPKKDATGCTVGYDCVKTTPTSCTSVGGQCVAISPTSCASGRWGDATKFSCGGGVGVGCCLEECPSLSPPAPGFCTGGTIKPRYDATGCVVGYDCVK